MTSIPKTEILRISTNAISAKHFILPQAIYMMQNDLSYRVVSSENENIQQQFAKQKIPYLILNTKREISVLSDLRSLFSLIRIIRKEKPIIVHTITPKAGLLGMMAAYICGVKFRMHDSVGLVLESKKGAKKLLLKKIEHLINTLATNVYPNSNSLGQKLLEYKIVNKNKLKLLGSGSTYGVDLDEFNAESLNPDTVIEIKEVLNFNSKNKYLLFVGRIVPDKGIIELINVFKKLLLENTNLKLVMVGDFENELTPLPTLIANEINSNKNIIHVPYTNKVAYYMHICSLFVFPTHREGFPNVLLEAAAIKCPIICSNATGNIDIVKDNETGYIFEVKNELELFNCLKDALLHQDKLISFSNNLFKSLQNKFEKNLVLNNLLTEYKLILNKM